LKPSTFWGVILSVGLLLFAGNIIAGVERGDQFGHHPYAEASRKELISAGSYRGTRTVLMQAPAANAFRDMVTAARNDGVHLIPISGFRSVAAQKSLFDRSIKRRGSELAAAKWVAPPGHSEHATGWAIDLGDENRPDTDVEQSFENTPAYRWLLENAARFHFEMSFPKRNQQGVSYEPWHWRFLGCPEANLIFHPSTKG
jgi:D-alanyl-D-alanine carboxypeptidase